MTNTPPRIIDIRLSEPGECFAGCFNPYRGEKRLKALEKEHISLHKGKISHQHLDGSYMIYPKDWRLFNGT